jgi:hypothetical protein
MVSFAYVYKLHLQAERQRLAAIPGMINQNQAEAQEMNDA